MIFQLNIILTISVLILNLFNYTDGSNVSNDDYFSYNTKQTANPTSRNSSNQWGLDTDTGSANARASRGVNNSSYNYPSTKQENDAAKFNDSPSVRGLTGLKFGANASKGVNNYSYDYSSTKQENDAAKYNDSPSVRGLTGLKFGNSLSTTSNSNLDKGYNSKASLTGSDEGAKYTSQYENPQTKPQSSFYSRDSSRVDSPANQENNRFPLNRTVGMQQTRVQTNPAVNRNSAYPATQPLSLTGTFNQSAGVKPMQQGLTATTPRTQLPTNGYNTYSTNDLSNLKKSGVYPISELIPTAKKLMTPIYEDEDSSKLIPNVNVVLELNQKMQEVQPKYFTAEKMYKNGELNSKAGNTCLPDPLEDDLKDQDRWKIYQCSNVLNESQIQTLFNIRKRSFKITIKETNAQEIMYCDITDSLGFDDVDFVWTSVVPKEGPPYNNMKYTRFLMHQNCWCSPDSSSADKNMGLTIATAGYISEDGSSVVSLNSGYFPFGFITLESMSVGGTKL